MDGPVTIGKTIAGADVVHDCASQQQVPFVPIKDTTNRFKFILTDVWRCSKIFSRSNRCVQACWRRSFSSEPYEMPHQQGCSYRKLLYQLFGNNRQVMLLI